MKIKILTIGFSGIFLVMCSICMIWIKTMLAPNSPVVSHRGGIYEEEFLLELSTTCENDIYYTMDGSIPTFQSLKYERPIKIADRSQEENVYRNIRNIVDNWKDYKPNIEPVEKGTVIRAITVSKWGYTSNVVTETYFIGINDLDENDMYILSLVAEPEELFGEDGIYVTGKEYDEWYLAKDLQDAEEPEPNFKKKIEIISNLEIYEKESQVLNQLIGLRIRGASSRWGYSKNFNLFSREEYSGSNNFDVELFEKRKTHSIMLERTEIYAMAADILSDRAVSTQKSKKAKVFINGEFWYNTYMMERYDRNYFKENYGVKEVAIIENESGISCKRPETQTEFEQLKEWIQKADFTDDEQWKRLNEKVDIQSYIDYMSANIYLCNTDFSSTKNYRRWFSEGKGSSYYEDGRMRWAIYDLDLIGEADRNTFVTPSPYGLVPVNENPFYQAFYVNDEFRRQFVLSFMDMANNNFSVENVEPVLNKYGMDLSWNNNFFLERYDYITSYLAKEFNETDINPPAELGRLADASGDKQSTRIKPPLYNRCRSGKPHEIQRRYIHGQSKFIT